MYCPKCVVLLCCCAAVPEIVVILVISGNAGPGAVSWMNEGISSRHQFSSSLHHRLFIKEEGA
jgi:hypothetical protein